jgi:hypothetical protein
MSIIRGARPESGYYRVSNTVSGDKKLSWAARGLLIFLLSKPDHWEVSVAALVNETAGSLRGAGGHTKRDGVKAILAELSDAGYIVRSDKPKHNPDGSFAGYDYIVSDSAQPSPDKPSTVEPSPVQPSTPNPTQVITDSKKELKNQVRTERRAPRSDLTFADWIETCKTSGERPVPESDSVFEYAENAGLPLDYIVLHWKEFKANYAESSKRYKDWRAVYRKSVRGNWFRLWFFNADGVCTLTTQGQQAHRIHKEQA